MFNHPFSFSISKTLRIINCHDNLRIVFYHAFKFYVNRGDVMSLASVKIADYNICLEVNQFSHFCVISKDLIFCEP